MRLLAALALLSGCKVVSDDLIAERLDPDADGLAYPDDCDDDDPAVGAGDIWYADRDADGFGDADSPEIACAQPDGFVDNTNDCDDASAVVNPDALEVCDDRDNDCDGEIDTDADTAPSWFLDEDGDGFGDAASQVDVCTAPPNYIPTGGDCDDTDPEIHPEGIEICDDGDADEDCDGTADDGDDDALGTVVAYLDQDGDGFGDGNNPGDFCDPPADTVSDDTDCNDSDAAVHPAATEVCDPADTDEDCSGTADDGDPGVSDPLDWYADTDTDGFGDASTATAACEAPAAHVADDTDCDDGDGAVFPSATELCNGVDDDCDTLVDEDDAADATTWYLDADSDGYGGQTLTLTQCAQPAGYIDDDTDCDDLVAAVNPGASEIWYDGVDQDCSGGSDHDQDGDGLDHAATAGGPDCNDTDPLETGCGTAAAPGVDCAQILSVDAAAADGPYWIDPAGNGAFEVVCDMTTQGGGWIALSTDQTDDLFVAQHTWSPWYKCEDDAVRPFPWLADETTVLADDFNTVATVYDYAVTYERPDTAAPYTAQQSADMRAAVSELADNTRMVAIVGDDDNGNLEGGGFGGHEVWIGDELDNFTLLSPGEDGDCGGAFAPGWPLPGSQSGLWFWHHTAALSVVAGTTVPTVDADLTGLPPEYVLPKTVRLHMASGGGAAFGWETQTFLVR